MLKYCASLGDCLTVGIDSDERVKKLKGSLRPINTAADRKYMLLSLRWVDHVTIFDSEEELTELVESIEPTYMIVGEDYRNKKVIGAEHAKKLIFFEKVNGYSTTNTLQRITSG